MNRADRKSQVRQRLGSCPSDFWSVLVFESAELPISSVTRVALTLARVRTLGAQGNQVHSITVQSLGILKTDMANLINRFGRLVGCILVNVQPNFV